MTKEEAKTKIADLIERYNSLSSSEIKLMNEETTKAKFIRPLFEALGWDFEQDVNLEEKISNGRVDYNFQINNQPKLFVEAKPLRADIDNQKYAQQAVNYAWLKNVNWAVLTDFVGIRIYYPSEHGQAQSCFRLNLENYLESFEDLWILSKESFENNLIDKQAEKWGAKPGTISVSDQLAKDMNSWRNDLSGHFKTWNKNLTEDQMDEGVQRILDRFIFIRCCEDRGIGIDSLRSKYRIWREEDGTGNFLAYLKPLFAEYQKTYNSGLFDEHPVMSWEVASDCFDKIISGLYQPNHTQEYNFSIINSDILGGVYEQYLGHLLSKSSDGDDSKKKRKSQGIYYTPTYIVDYIVQNTLAKKLAEVGSARELKSISVLDPACGSGSFLVKALETLNEKYKELRYAGDEYTKIEILNRNIFGVDLDQQAVEIAQLNLMLKTLEIKSELPHIANIKCGNSLVDDPKIAGEFAFDWKAEFPEIMKSGGFDVIIGNPPYVSIIGISIDDRKMFEKIFQSATGRFDIFMLFIEKSVTLLKNGGILGFIIPNKFLTNDQSQELRQYLLKNGKISSILFLPEQVFVSASVSSIVLTFVKAGKSDSCSINEYEGGSIVEKSIVSNQEFAKQSENKFVPATASDSNSIFQKVEHNSIKLEEIADVRDGIVAGRIKELLFHKEKIDSSCKPLLFGADINRYQKSYSGNYVDYREEIMKKYEAEKITEGGLGLRMRNKELYERPKILTRKTADRIIATFDDENYYYEQTLHSTYLKDKQFSPLFILALLNSNLFKYYYQSKTRQSGTIFPQVRISFLKSLPIKKAGMSKQGKIINLSDEMTKLNKELQKIERGTNRWNQIHSEIEKTDKLIDQKVYELYGLTAEEIKVIEESVK